MIIVIAEHFLDDAGRQRFPAWIQSVRVLLQSYEGYVSLQQLKDVQAEDRLMVELRFAKFELLRSWSASEDHKQAMERLSQYRTKKQVSNIYQYV